MGNRESLIDGAKRVLLEKGARGTARDIAEAADVSLAAIGYHFGSKDELMLEAMLQSVGAWAEGLTSGLQKKHILEAAPAQRCEMVWSDIIARVKAHHALWAANMEMLPEIERSAVLKTAFAGAIDHACRDLAALFLDMNREDPAARRIGTFYYSLMIGVVTQHLIDPEHAPSAKELAVALQAAAKGFSESP